MKSLTGSSRCDKSMLKEQQANNDPEQAKSVGRQAGHNRVHSVHCVFSYDWSARALQAVVRGLRPHECLCRYCRDNDHLVAFQYAVSTRAVQLTTIAAAAKRSANGKRFHRSFTFSSFNPSFQDIQMKPSMTAPRGDTVSMIIRPPKPLARWPLLFQADHNLPHRKLRLLCSGCAILSPWPG
jgi:hypothetical protein